METITRLAGDIWGVFWPFGISDLIDILIMALIIYRVMLLIRTTSSGAVAKGILILLVALWGSSYLRFNTVNFLLGRLVEWGVLALVVLFQPELRRFLEQMGRSSIGKVFVQQEERDELDGARSEERRVGKECAA